MEIGCDQGISALNPDYSLGPQTSAGSGMPQLRKSTCSQILSGAVREMKLAS